MKQHAMAFLVVITALIASTGRSMACACCDTWQVVNVAKGDVLNIRSGPSTRFRKIGSIPNGSGCVVKLGACKRHWCRISYIDQKGWVSSRYLRYIK
ncbi:MAG: SH3 domain-containing protein [Hyphomicrobiaceae bacterium]